MLTAGAEVVSERPGVGGAVQSEWGVDGALLDSASSSFFFFSCSLLFPLFFWDYVRIQLNERLAGS